MNSNSTLRITYVTGTDGWGQEPTDEDIATFTALVEHRLAERFPGAIVSAEVDSSALESRVSTNSDEIDRAEIVSWIGNEIWEEWCSGERAPGEWTTDADVLGAADAGELFRVEGAEAFPLSRTDVVNLLRRVERGEERAVYCHDWILVRASSAVDALVTSRSFDEAPIVLDEIMAVVAS